MIDVVYDAIESKKDTRKNLSLFRQCLKEEELPARVQSKVFRDLLLEEDPKIRKNAVLILGEIDAQDALDDIYEGYIKEDKNFVKSSYLVALGNLDCRKYLDDLEDKYTELCNEQPAEEDKKHVNAQIKELEKIHIRFHGLKKHIFTGYDEKNDLLLTIAREYRDVLAKQLKDVKCEEHPFGMRVHSFHLEPLLNLRTYREMLFAIDCNQKLSADPVKIGRELAQSDLLNTLRKNHDGAEPFYFRLEIRSSMTLDKKAVFAKRIAETIESVTERKLINSTSYYEVEIRLVESREGYFLPCMKLYTIPMTRFDYRKNSIAASIHPASCGLIMELVKPYLKEKAQILDPFCGVGTMLIERDTIVPAGDMYGLDIFGEAIEKARENTDLAGKRISYIHRDFFDFKHSYLFDEIITNMPVRGRKTKEEQDAFYGRFFTKAAEHLNKEGIMILYSNEIGFVKKQIRLDTRYKLLQEYCMRKKDGFYVFIIEFKG